MKVEFGDFTIGQTFVIDTDEPPVQILDNRGYLLIVDHPKGLEKYKINEVGHFKSYASKKAVEATRYTRPMQRTK